MFDYLLIFFFSFIKEENKKKSDVLVSQKATSIGILTLFFVRSDVEVFTTGKRNIITVGRVRVTPSLKINGHFRVDFHIATRLRGNQTEFNLVWSLEHRLRILSFCGQRLL